MRYSPTERLTPYQAMMHPYFNDLRDKDWLEDIKSEMEVPQLFNFNEEECSYEEYQQLTPTWLR